MFCKRKLPCLNLPVTTERENASARHWLLLQASKLPGQHLCLQPVAEEEGSRFEEETAGKTVSRKR